MVRDSCSEQAHDNENTIIRGHETAELMRIKHMSAGREHDNTAATRSESEA